jgi:hypothetical protein
MEPTLRYAFLISLGPADLSTPRRAMWHRDGLAGEAALPLRDAAEAQRLKAVAYRRGRGPRPRCCRPC